MRAHLPACEACNGYYARHMMLARLDPQALRAEERIARGLGLRARPTGLRVLPFATASVVAAAAAVALLLTTGKHPADEGFRSRGTVDSTPSCRITVYRVGEDGTATPAPGALHHDDELALAYENLGGKRYLMIFGVDEHREVYWFFPAWTAAADEPSSLAIEPTSLRTELHEAVRHQLHGGHLDVRALFTDEPHTVRDVERRVAETGALGALGIRGSVECASSFAVVP
jgi:hypothetical protein